MNPPIKDQSTKFERSDAEWLASLSGKEGRQLQQKALQDVARYLHVVAYNYLRRCQVNSPTLCSLDNSEIAIISEDHVSSFMERLTKDDFALLDKYSRRGRFTAWASAVLVNMMASEMRRASWRKQIPLSTSISTRQVDEHARQPDRVAIQNSILMILQNGIDEMPMRYQVALTRCLLEGDSAKNVASDLQITPNAVHILVYRAKQNIRKYLIANHVDQSDLYLFS